MHVVRGENDMIFTSCSWDETNGEEVVYESKEEAEHWKNDVQGNFQQVLSVLWIKKSY